MGIGQVLLIPEYELQSEICSTPCLLAGVSQRREGARGGLDKDLILQ